MKQNKSRLHPVIKVKTFKEKKAQGELVQIQATRNLENTALSALNKKKEHALDAAVRTIKAKATEVQTSRAFIQKLSLQIHQQEKKIENIRVQENDKRVELTEKTQSRKMVEKLDEKRREALARETDRKEQRMLDVLARRLTFVL
jgi:flagellar export protein FliJ